MDEAEKHFKAALELQAHERWAEAMEVYQALLKKRPELNAVRNNLAVCLSELGRAEEAVQVLKPMLETHPLPEALTNLGNALRSLGRFSQAEEAYTQAVAACPMEPRSISNLALAQQDQGKLDEAVASFERAVSLAPGDASLRANLGSALLMMGDYKRGFPAYEFRLAGSATESAMKQTGLPIWDGSPLAGRRLLVWTEQGLGDSLQFLRFLPGLDGKIVLMAQGALMRLAQGVPGVEAVYGWNDAPPACDAQIPLLSLARLSGCAGEADIPPSLLTPDPLLVDLWGTRLAELKGLRVGLSWQGNPAMKADRARSVSLAALKPLFKLPGISWVSLQTGPGGEQLHKIAAPLLDLGLEISDLADTAAIMAHLDLIISVDSAVAHLAGGLNRPVWVMVRANPDWRWKPKAESSAWYPMAMLWRQQRLGDWSGVVAGMAEKLATYPLKPS